MVTRTRSLAWTAIAATIAAAAVVSVAEGYEQQVSSSETGETRELVNQADCWTGGVISALGRCILQ